MNPKKNKTQKEKLTALYTSLQEYDKIQTPEITFKTSLKNNNNNKNRYNNVLANEKTIFPPNGFPYICANLLKKEEFEIPFDFVVCQAPKTASFIDFWEIILKYKIFRIFMLTQLKERNNDKADKYWPNVGESLKWKEKNINIDNNNLNNNNNTSEITLTLTQEHPHPIHREIIIRIFEIKKEDNNNNNKIIHNIEHYQYLGWPDFGVPLDTTGFNYIINLLLAMSSLEENNNLNNNNNNNNLNNNNNNSPVMVHCSAGIGRTGTLIAVYIGKIREIKMRNNNLNNNNIIININYEIVFDIIMRMKLARTGMVQGPEQLGFILDRLNIVL